jgi:HAD superfamily hydrolase (TIGR01450 family)
MAMAPDPSGAPSARAAAQPGAGFVTTTQPLAAVHDVALLDLDGVVYVGESAVPHAAGSLDEALARHGMRSAFVTNNASRTPAVVGAHLRALGVHAADSEVVTSAQAGARVLAGWLPPGARVLAGGGPGVAWALEERGLVPVHSADDDPAAVIQGYGPDVSWRELAEASLAISRGLPWVATNLDRTIPSPRGRVLGNGSMVAALRHATGVDPVVAGKPEPPLMLESVERTGARRPLVVGDRLDTDIEGATRSGIPALLVLTGVTDWHDVLGVEPHLRPSYLAADLRGLLEPAPEVTVQVVDREVAAQCRTARIRVPATEPDAAAPGPGANPAAWLPEPLAIGAAASAPDGDLDAVRAALAVSWVLHDRGLVAAGPAILAPA